MSAGLIYLLVFYAGLVAALTLAEVKENRLTQNVLKPAAALGFIIISFFVGLPESLYGQLILLGLIACAVGDICLLSRRSQKLFLAGMGAFALGHLAYLSAFVFLEGLDSTLADLIKAGVIILLGLGVFTWLKPHLPRAMEVPVVIYFIIILAMVMTALRLPAQGPLLYAVIGAVMFAASDVFVARDRFVSPDPRNALAISPLYFGAQALIALSTAGF